MSKFPFPPITIPATTITARGLHWLARNAAATVLHASDHTCNLLDSTGNILSLVTPAIGRGPFALVVPVQAFTGITSGLNVAIGTQPASVHIGHWHITTHGAETWEARPHWPTISPHLPQVLPWLRQMLDEHTATHTPAVQQWPHLVSGLTRLSQAIRQGDETHIRSEVTHLAGFGPGLTPAGDDGIMGILYGVWATQTSYAAALPQQIATQAKERTTTLSGAFLDAAADGEAVQAWHNLVAVIPTLNPSPIQQAARTILAIGDSSGACALAGFLTFCTGNLTIHTLEG